MCPQPLTRLLLACVCLTSACGEAETSNAGTQSDTASDGISSADAGAADSDAEPSGEGEAASTSAGNTGSDAEAGDGDGDCVDWRVGMTPTSQTLILTTSDGKALAATLTLPGAATCRPALLLVHQFQQSQEQWGSFGDSLAARGFVVLAVDLRGHGLSDSQDGALSELLTDPDQAPLDIRAGVDALVEHPAVAADAVAIFGTSIGANLALAAQHTDERVRRSVALSPRLEPTLALAGSPASITLHDIYCIAGELDGGGDQAQSCNTLSTAALGSAQSVVLDGTAAHGVTIFSDFPQEVENAVLWLEGLSG